MEVVHRKAIDLDALGDRMQNHSQPIAVQLYFDDSLQWKFIVDYTKEYRRLFETEKENFDADTWKKISELLDRMYIPLDTNDMIG